MSVETLLWIIREVETWNADLRREGDVDFFGTDDGLTLTLEFVSDLMTRTVIKLDHMTGCFRIWINGDELTGWEWN